jgi:hypothetical protein
MKIFCKNKLAFIASLLYLSLFTCSERRVDMDMVNTGLPGTDGKITSLASYKEILYAGGEFNVAGTVFAKNIARWNGVEWAALNEGFEVPVTAMACDKKGHLYVAGTRWEKQNPNFGYPVKFSGTVIRVWDGSKWKNIGTVNQQSERTGTIYDMVFDSRGRLYVAGDFVSIEDCSATNIAFWDGANWHPVGEGKGFPLGPHEKYCPDCFSGDPIRHLVAGKKDIIYAVNKKHVGCWDGADWSMVGDTLRGGPAGLALNADGLLAACGQFPSRDQNNLPLALFKNGVWEYPNIQFSSSATTIGFDSKGALLLGTISTLSSFVNNELWVLGGPDFENQLQGNVQTLLLDHENNLYAAGYDLDIGGKAPSSSILHWDGSQWNLLYTRISRTNQNASDRPAKLALPKSLPLPDSLDSYKIESFTITSNNQVYISGNFEIFIGKECLTRLAHWDGKAWHAVGPGLPAPAEVLAVDGFGNLYAGGSFPNGGWNSYDRLLRWDGATWQAIQQVPGRISALACDQSGYLYIGLALPGDAGPFTQRLYRWNDSTMTPVEGGPTGFLRDGPLDGIIGKISQLDVIGSKLHVQGDFTTASNKVSPGYAVYELGAPDKAHIEAKRAAKLAASSMITLQTAEVGVEESYCHLGTSDVVRFEKYIISNSTSAVLDSAVLYTEDTVGFMFDETGAPWAKPPAISNSATGFRYSFPLSAPLTPGMKQQLWVKKRVYNRVSLLEPDAWVFKDTLRALFNDLEFVSSEFRKDPMYQLSIVEYDSFAVIQGGNREDTQYFIISGLYRTPFEVRFAKKTDYDPVCRDVIAYVNYITLINDYTPAPHELLPKLKTLSRIKQVMLVHTLVTWCFSFPAPVNKTFLWDLIGEGEGTVPEDAELIKRFKEISQFTLDALTILKPSLQEDTYLFINDKVANWKLPECGYNEPSPPVRIEGDLVYCNKDGEVSFYPMELIRSILKLLGTGSGESLKTFNNYFE